MKYEARFYLKKKQLEYVKDYLPHAKIFLLLHPQLSMQVCHYVFEGQCEDNYLSTQYTLLALVTMLKS